MKVKTLYNIANCVLVLTLGCLHTLSPGGGGVMAAVKEDAAKLPKAPKLKGKKSKKQKPTDDELACAEYCELYSGALKRCPYSSSNLVAEADPPSCVQGCIEASFSKTGSDQDFSLKDTLQCRMNHAKMGIKEGALTNSNHCLHASLAGPERCVTDEISLTQDSQLAAGKYIFYNFSGALQTTEGDMTQVAQLYLASISYLIAMRRRLLVTYPNIKDEPDKNAREYTLRRRLHKEEDCSSVAKNLYRTIDGTCNNLDNPSMGAVNTKFVHNLKPSEPHKDGDVDVSKVANILKRPYGEEPAPNTLESFNQLASAWIQFMTHDWFQHDRFEESGKNGELHNRVTHWWDASQIYGSSAAEEANVRLENGKIHLDANNELDYDETGTPRTGFGENFWVGLHTFHTIFAREHNFIVDTLGDIHPDMTSNEKYDTARLCISAMLAKIHTVSWTPALLDNSPSTLSLNINWYGLKNTIAKFFTPEQLAPLQATIDTMRVPSMASKEFGTNLTNYNSPFQMTEEFIGVYRMHPLLPDNLEIGGESRTLQEMSFNDARELTNETNATEVFIQALSKAPARALSLQNYPYSLYDLDVPGRGKINLAEIDLMRDRERKLPRYNDARRQLLLEPYASLDNLTNNEVELDLLKSVYTDIEQVDFMVGCLVDKERPEGFAFGIVPYHIFIVMASLRLFSDRFFMEGMTVENYKPWGLNYLMTESFQSILVRNFPALDGIVPANPFLNDWSWAS